MVDTNVDKKKIKILYIHHGWGIGGAPISLLFLLKDLDKSKYSPKIICLYKSDASTLFQREGFEVVFATKYQRFFGHNETGKIKYYQIYSFIKTIFHWFMTAFIYAPKILLKEKPDLIHLNSDVLSSWAYAANKLNFKVICHVREPIAKGLFGLRKYFLKCILDKSVSYFIAISKDNADRLGLTYKTIVIYNSIDLVQFNPSKYLSYDDVLSSNVEILFLGGLHKAKGFLTLAEALNYIDHDIKVIFAGHMNRKYNLFFSKSSRKIKEIKKFKNIKIMGLVENVPLEMSKCDIVVFPSTKPHFARPIIEAGAMMKPVIASDLPGMSEIVIDGITGLLVEPKNPKKLADAINKLAFDEQSKKIMGENGYKRAIELFDAEKNTRKVEEIYESILRD